VDRGFQVVIDYAWGHPAEVFLAAITRKEFAVIPRETRLLQVGEGAGPTILLAAAALPSRKHQKTRQELQGDLILVSEAVLRRADDMQPGMIKGAS
jgi:hypothetical protein